MAAQTLTDIYCDTVRRITAGIQHATEAYTHAMAGDLLDARAASSRAKDADIIAWAELWDSLTIHEVDPVEVVEAYEVGCGAAGRAMTGCVFAARAARSVDQGRVEAARDDAARAARMSPVWGRFANALQSVVGASTSTD